MAIESEADGYYKVYEEYSKVLRTWFVAYGIGGPMLFLTNETAAKTMKAAADAKFIALLFLAGVAIQVILASINKVAMWVLYYGETKSAVKDRWFYRKADQLSEQFWIDIAADFTTLALFGVATWKVFLVVVEAT